MGVDEFMVLQHATLYGYEWHLPGVARGFLELQFVDPARGLSQRQRPVVPLQLLRIPIEPYLLARRGRFEPAGRQDKKPDVRELVSECQRASVVLAFLQIRQEGLHRRLLP